MSSGFMRVEVKIPPRVQKLITSGPEIAAAAEKRVMAQYGAKMEAEVKQRLSVGGYGPLRKAKRRGGRARIRDYSPSKTGQAPHLKTGALRSSMGFSVRSIGRGAVALLIGSVRSGSARDAYTGKSLNFKEGVGYSKHLEAIRRPYLTPVVKKYKAAIRKDLIAAILNAFKRS